MKLTEIFIFAWNFFLNFLKSIFKPAPDTRYKLFFENGLIKHNANDANMIPVCLNQDYSLEFKHNGKIVNIFKVSDGNGNEMLFGLPIFCTFDLTISLIDNCLFEQIESKSFKRGDFIDYKSIFDGHMLFKHIEPVNHVKQE